MTMRHINGWRDYDALVQIALPGTIPIEIKDDPQKVLDFFQSWSEQFP